METSACPCESCWPRSGSTATIAGVKVVARALRDAGFHVIYPGLWQSPEAVVRTVADEDADWLGISLLSGTHMTLVPRILELLRAAGLAARRRAGRRHHSRGRRSQAAGAGRGPRLRARHAAAGDRRLSARRGEPHACLTTCSRGCGQHDRLALARLLTLVARGEQLDAIRAARRPPSTERTPVVAITGNAGVGKSTLVGKLAEYLRGAGQDRGRAGLRSAKSAHRRGPAGRSRAHAQPARRRRALHPQPGRRQRAPGRGRTRRPDDPAAGANSAST